MIQRARTLVVNLFLLVFSSLMFLGAIEVVMRLYDEKPEIRKELVPTAESSVPEERVTFHRYHPIIGYEGKPNVEKDFWFHMVRQNSRGERGIEHPYQRDKSKLRILLLGDSGTWGYPLDDKDTIWSILDQELREKNRASEVINLGTIGYSADQELLSYILNGMNYHPDIVLINFFAENDLWEMMTDSAWGVFRPRMLLEGDNLCLSDVPVTKASGWPDTNLGEMFGFNNQDRTIFERSKLFSFFKSREIRGGIKSLFQSDEIKTPLERTEMVKQLKKYLPCIKFEELPTPNYFDYPKRDEEAIRLYLKVISLLRDIVLKQNAQLFVSLIPSKESYSGQNQNYLKVKSGLESIGISPIDLDQLAKSAGLSEEQLFTIGHQNGAGNRLIVKELINRIHK